MELTPSEQIMYNVLHIKMLDSNRKSVGTATGFLFGFCESEEGSIVCLVTNRHVLAGCERVGLQLTRRTADNKPDIGNLIDIEIPTTNTVFHPDPNIDLAVLPVSFLLNKLKSLGNNPFVVSFQKANIPTAEEWKEFSAIEQVVMAGFPKGLRDEVNNQPIIRSGITATHPALDFKGNPEFLIDMPCYEGCSGSPVMICDEGLYVDKRTNGIMSGPRVKLLGIQYAIPSKYLYGHLAVVKTAESIAPVVPLYMNLGFIIKSTELLVFENLLNAKFDPKAAVVI